MSEIDQDIREKATEVAMDLPWFNVPNGDFDEAVQFIARALQDERDGGWQPIETAPKDGTIILTWSKRMKFMLAYWGRTDEINAPAWMGGHCRVNHIDQPTAWRPLPSPPHTFTPDQTETLNERHGAGERA